MYVGHDGRRVAVYQHNLQTFLLQRAAGLGACIVKLRCLTDNNRAGADNENLFNIIKLRHN